MEWKVGEPIDEILSTTDVQAYLNEPETLSTGNANVLEDMIKAARQMCEEYCMRSFVKKTYTLFVHTFDLDNGKIILPFPPHIAINSVHSVFNDGSSIQLTLNSDFYKTGINEFMLEFISTVNTVSDDSRPIAYKVIYDAGYGDSETDTFPEPLRIAMLKLISDWWGKRDDYQPFLHARTKKMLNKYVSYDWF